MKNYILPALCWALALSQSFAQTLPANAQRLLQKAGLEARQQPANAAVQTRNVALQLDSTKTFVNYVANDSTPTTRVRYQYPVTGVTIEYNDEFLDGQWQVLSRATEVTDNLDRVVDVFAEAFDPVEGVFKPESRLEVFPHENSLTQADSFAVYTWETNDWAVALKVNNVFNAQDRLVESYTLFSSFGTSVVFKDVFTYDASGNNTLIKSFGLFEGVEIPTTQTNNTYVGPRLVESIESMFTGVGFSFQSRIRYQYTGAGAITLIENSEWSVAANDWQVAQTTAYEYDTDGRTTAQQTETFGEGSVEKLRITYVHLNLEDLLYENAYHWDETSATWVFDSRTWYYYAGTTSSVDPTPKPLPTLAISPNPTVDVVRFLMTETRDVQVFNTAGQLVHAEVLQPGQSLRVTDLPTGIYPLVVRQEDGTYYTGKIVKN